MDPKTTDTVPSELTSTEPDETEQSEIDRYIDDLDAWREGQRG